MKRKKILAIASSGGHWVQLLRLRPAFDGCEVVFASTNKSYVSDVSGHDFHAIKNADRKSAGNFFFTFLDLYRTIRKIKPDIIITTGSAPGLTALVVGKLFSTKNVWIDSIANVEKLSTSGKIAKYFADLYLTQWEDLAQPNGPYFKGNTL
jgi:UDP-N-acetylglucosamine:LPS N-acetylglucosamine transferase